MPTLYKYRAISRDSDEVTKRRHHWRIRKPRYKQAPGSMLRITGVVNMRVLRVMARDRRLYSLCGACLLPLTVNTLFNVIVREMRDGCLFYYTGEV